MAKQVDACMFCDSVPCTCNTKAPRKSAPKVRKIETVQLPEPAPVVKADRTRPPLADDQAILVKMIQNLEPLLDFEEKERNKKVFGIKLSSSEQLAAWKAMYGSDSTG